MPEDFERRKRSRKVLRWRRKKLPGGKYLQIAVTKEAGPRGGHTLAYVQHSKAGATYPAKTEEPTRRRVKVRKKHGRQVKVRAR